MAKIEAVLAMGLCYLSWPMAASRSLELRTRRTNEFLNSISFPAYHPNLSSVNRWGVYYLFLSVAEKCLLYLIR